MKRSTRKTLTVVVAVTACLFCCTASEAKKPPKPPGGGPPAYTIIPFSPPGVASTASMVHDFNDLGCAVGGAVVGGSTLPLHLDVETGDYTVMQGTAAIGDNNLNQIVGDVNRQLSRDVKESGRFMTLFLCEIDGQIKTIRWVNAGHDPALIFDQSSGKFKELTGRALPLGVYEETGYQEFQGKLAPDQIILIGTDGIWESQNTAGQMFGKERFRNVIRTNASKTAKEILQAVINEIDKFCHPLKNEDDVTLVVIKVDSQRNLN
jgi:hypothetical protein